MNSPREVYAFYTGGDSNDSIFEVRFHNGWYKTYKITVEECMANRCSARDLLELKIIEFYEELEGSEPPINFFFS